MRSGKHCVPYKILHIIILIANCFVWIYECLNEQFSVVESKNGVHRADTFLKRYMTWNGILARWIYKYFRKLVSTHIFTNCTHIVIQKNNWKWLQTAGNSIFSLFHCCFAAIEKCAASFWHSVMASFGEKKNKQTNWVI